MNCPGLLLPALASAGFGQCRLTHAINPNCPVTQNTWYAEHNLLIFGQLRPGEFKGGYATTYCGCLAAPIGVLCLVVYRVDLLRRYVWSASVAGAVECWFGSRFGEARIG